MKIFSELTFSGSYEQLCTFIEDIDEYINGDWTRVQDSDRWKEYLFIDYNGNLVDKARVSIYLGDDLQDGEIKVGNIVPLEKNVLNVDEYNAILKKFYTDIIEPYKRTNPSIDISDISSDMFDPLNIISRDALKKLTKFCNNANKSTGSTNIRDQERWYDFICQTVDDELMFDYDTLAEFLQDEEYWGHKEDDFIGVIGKFAWSSEQAYKLADEYEKACSLLMYYKEKRGL